MIAVIDYDAGNLKSVEKAFGALGFETKVTRDKKELMRAEKVVLPGVGSFGDAMANLKKYEMDRVIKDIVAEKKPFLGICLGLQLLFEHSEESPGVEGLGILKGAIRHIPQKEGMKIPHMGWNSLTFQNEGRLFRGIEQAYVYFVHSYYLRAEEESIVKAVTDYGTKIHAAVEKENVFACQFHPEKSSHTGLHMLKNFAEL